MAATFMEMDVPLASGTTSLIKPLVIYEDDRIDTETVELGDAEVVIAEGVYTSLLENVDLRIFIARSRLETLAHREKRGREKIEPFIEGVLEIEHEIISQHRARADVVISRDFDVEFGARPLRRVIQQKVEDPLSDRLLSGEFVDGDMVEVDVSADGEVELKRAIPVAEPSL